MTAPVRIRLSRAKGWRMPANTVKVDRTTKWGNPFNLKAPDHCWTAISVGFKGNPTGRHEASVYLFREWIEQGRALRLEGCGLYAGKAEEAIPLGVAPAIDAHQPPALADVRRELRGKNLACWCRLDQPCHADVLLELANAEPGQ